MRTLAIITQTRELFRLWVKENGKPNEEYLHVYRKEHLTGVEIDDFVLATYSYRGGFAFTDQRELEELAENRVKR